MKSRVFKTLRDWGTFRRALFLYLAAFLAVGPTGLFAATYYVNQATGDDSRTAAQAANPLTPWQTVTRALMDPDVLFTRNPDLAPGDMVVIGPGTFNEENGESWPVLVPVGVTVAGAGPGVTILEDDPNGIDPNSPPGLGIFYGGATTDLGADSVIANMTLSGATGHLMGFAGWDGVTQSPTIENIEFENAFTGILIGGMGLGYEFSGLIQNNSFTGLPVGVGFAQGTIYSLSMDTLSPTIRNNKFTVTGVGVGGIFGGYFNANVDFSPEISFNTFEYGGINVGWMRFYGAMNTEPVIASNNSTLAGEFVGALEIARDPNIPVDPNDLNSYLTNFSPTITGNSVSEAVAGAMFYLAINMQDPCDPNSSSVGVTFDSNVLEGLTGEGEPTSASGFGLFGGIDLSDYTNNGDSSDRVELGHFDLAVTNNRIMNFGLFGVASIMDIGRYTGIQSLASFSVDVSGNTITGNGYLADPNAPADPNNAVSGGLALLLWQPGPETGPYDVANNIITNNGNANVVMLNGLGTALIRCNTITGAGLPGGVGFYVLAPTVSGAIDLGDDPNDPGYNTFSNPLANLASEGFPDITAEGNYFLAGVGSTINFDTDPALGSPPVACTAGAVINEADLEIEKLANHPSVNAGGGIVYTINVTNNGPDSATNVVVTDDLPPDVTFVSAPGCTESGGTVTCDIASLAASASSQFEITILAPPYGTEILNVATVTADEIDPTPGNASSSAPVVVNPAHIPIPTASEWAMIILTLTLAMTGVWIMRKRRGSTIAMMLALTLVFAVSFNAQAAEKPQKRAFPIKFITSVQQTGPNLVFRFHDGTTMTEASGAVSIVTSNGGSMSGRDEREGRELSASQSSNKREGISINQFESKVANALRSEKSKDGLPAIIRHLRDGKTRVILIEPVELGYAARGQQMSLQALARLAQKESPRGETKPQPRERN